VTLLFKLVYQNEQIFLVSFGSFNERNEQIDSEKDLFILMRFVSLDKTLIHILESFKAL